MCSPKVLPCSCSFFFFSLPAPIFTLLAVSISHFLTANFHVFFSQQNSSPLFFSDLSLLSTGTSDSTQFVTVVFSLIKKSTWLYPLVLHLGCQTC